MHLYGNKLKKGIVIKKIKNIFSHREGVRQRQQRHHLVKTKNNMLVSFKM